MKHEENCDCCNGTGLCTDIEGTEGACMNCNGSGKHKWDDEKKCTCNLRTKLVGDGCEICNPDYASQFKEDE